MSGYQPQMICLIRLVAEIPAKEITSSENTKPQKGFSTYRGSSLISMNNAKIGPVIRIKSSCIRLEARSTLTRNMNHFEKVVKICFMLFTYPDQGYKDLIPRACL